MKYRVWNVRRFMKENEVAILGNGKVLYFQEGTDSEYIELDFLRVNVTHSSGVEDKNGKESHEGDIIKWSVIESDYQDHYGDNIPNGHYHEHLGYSVKTHIETIVFENGVFGTKGLGKDEPAFPLLWTGQQDYPDDYREWFEEENLFKQFGFESIEQLLDSLQGFEVIGNIYENPELLK